MDVEEDRKAGKKNIALNVNVPKRIFLLIGLLALGILPWFFLGMNSISFYLWIGIIVSLILYTIKPFRFKERGILGVFLDAAYGHVLPVLVLLFLLHSKFQPDFKYSLLLLVVIIIITFLKGLRNIINHQLNDRKSDKINEVNTFVLSFSPLASLNLLNRYIIPIEGTGLLFFHLVLAFTIPVFPLFFLFFMTLIYFSFSAWKWFKMPRRQLRFKFLYFLNDYYEYYLPLFCLLYLIYVNPIFFIILILHLILFPNLIKKIRDDFLIIRKNIS